ncbi:kinase-like domain-containing protein [Trametes elegans]|nr:kinase-like domain-containing protein [Trametes elegans]
MTPDVLSLTLQELKRLLAVSPELHGEARVPGPWQVKNSPTARSVRLVQWKQIPLVVKYGTEVCLAEAETTIFVSLHTTVRVPRIYGTFVESDRLGDESRARQTVTYIFEEQLLGQTLTEVWPLLTCSERKTIEYELADVFFKLSSIGPSSKRCLGPLRGSWKNAWFFPFQARFPYGEQGARTTQSFLAYFQDIAFAKRKEDGLERFDLYRRAVFSHGDLRPANIMINAGHIVGIIDWAEAGWYPYFWDSFVLECSTFAYRKLRGWDGLAQGLGAWYADEAHEFLETWVCAMEMV